ncbi:MAG: hypothetical protein K6G90_07695 [Clostridia bacterium]|nr:hypothetical protein [Clostridia bacterium]
MSLDMATVILMIKKLLILIFERFEVIQEFDAIGVNVYDLLADTTAPKENP